MRKSMRSISTEYRDSSSNCKIIRDISMKLIIIMEQLATDRQILTLLSISINKWKS